MVDGLLVPDASLQPVAKLPEKNGRDAGVQAFFGRQVHIAMEHYGRLDPLDLDEYLAHDGFVALAKCLGVDV